MAGLLDFLQGNGLLGGPGAMTAGAGDPSQMQMAQMQMPQPSMAQPQVAQAPQQQVSIPQPIAGSGGFAGFLAGLNPQVANAIYQQRTQQAILSSLVAQGYSLPEAYAIFANQKVQEAKYGAPTNTGELVLPNGAHIPTNSYRGGAPTPNIPNDPVIRSLLGAPVKLGDAKVGEISGPSLYQNGQVVNALPGVGGGQAAGQAGQSTAFPGATNAPNSLQNAIDLNNQMKQSGAEAQARGKAYGERQTGLDMALSNADYMLGLIDSVRKDPSLSSALGPVMGHLPPLVGGQARAVSKVEQLEGQAFMQAWNALKAGGSTGGRITQYEAQRATDAMARLNRVQSPDDFKQALNELEGLVRTVRTRIGTSAGVGPTPAPEQNPSLTKEGIVQPGQQAQEPSQPAAKFQDGQTATNPKTGQKLIFRNGQWAPLQ